jgi:diguanylate cyclase (GGDEF)-like protein
MHALAISCLVMASVNFYVAAYYFFFYIKRPLISEHLPFSLLCLSVGLYDLFCIGLYNAGSLQDGIFWQRFQLDIAAVISVFLIWFTAAFTGQKTNKILRFSMAWFLLILAAAPFVSPRFTLDPSNPAVKHVHVFNLPAITYYEGAVGMYYQLEILSAVCLFAYLGYLFLRYYQKTPYRTLLLVLLCQFIYFAGMLNDSFVSLQTYSFMYISEYTFFFIIIAMAYILFDKFVNLHGEVEELNITLEQKVYERTCEVEKLNEDLKRSAEYDPLTGVYNRRFFNDYFEIEMKRAMSNREHKMHLSPDGMSDMNFGFALIGIDHFKLINDTYGHLIGDSVLMQIIAVIQENIFDRDVLCRYGGDEFALILTKTSQRGVFQAAEKIRREIDEHSFIFGKGLPRQHVTVSVGLVNFDELLNKGREEALKLADDRLEMAKIAGRNRTVYGNAVND